MALKSDGDDGAHRKCQRGVTRGFDRFEWCDAVRGQIPKSAQGCCQRGNHPRRHSRAQGRRYHHGEKAQDAEQQRKARRSAIRRGGGAKNDVVTKSDGKKAWIDFKQRARLMLSVRQAVKEECDR